MNSDIQTYGRSIEEEKVAAPAKPDKRKGRRRNRILQHNPKMYEF